MAYKIVNTKKIEDAMTAQNMKNKTLAERINVSPSMITRYLNGESEMSATILCRIASNLNVSMDYLCDAEPSGSMSIVGLTSEQVKIIQNLATAFRNHNCAIKKKLSAEQYELLGQIVAEFSK